MKTLHNQNLSRRRFLHLSAITAVSGIIAACGGETALPNQNQAAPTAAGTAPQQPAGGPTEAPIAMSSSQAKEPPMLKALVDSGKLPPVTERLPANPYVPPHKWLQTGKYGGVMQWSANWPDGIGAVPQESQYGHSLLRWLNDGLDIGPGLVESWEKNEDASQWTLHFRQGLKWSDGEPWSTGDIMFWWNDMVNNPDYTTERPPDEARSGKGTLMELKQIDEHTLQMTFDAPAPLTADRLAMWVNGNAGKPIGPTWMVPAHYVKQFHPKYNPDVKDYTTFDQKAQFRINPDCPTMTGWRLKSYEEGVRGVWERNPYYWCVDKEGNQLPYIDSIVVTGFQDKEVHKLAFLDGKIDYDNFSALTLADVQALKAAEPKSNTEVRLWDSGSGTASIFFFSQDYKDENMRKLIRMPEFRKALSMAYNRQVAQKSIYYNTGEPTTGTLSPKAIEYNVNDEGKQTYQSWRDSAVKYDPEAAMALLDKIGVKDVNGDGMREMPDGSPLQISLDYPADTGPEHINKNNLLVNDWKAIGINAVPNPVVPTAYDEQWKGGALMSKTAWEVGDGPNHLVYPQWLVPIEFSRWAPLQGTYYDVRGTPKEKEEQDVDPYKRTPPRMEPEKGGPVEQLWSIYDKSKVEPDPMKRHQLVWDMIKIHVEQGPFFQGTVANYPRIIIVKKGLMNVPQKEDLAQGGFVNPWIHPTPAVYDPETWFWDNPEAHS